MCCFDKIKAWKFSDWCKKGYCSCWFEGWWGIKACRPHDINYQQKAHLGTKVKYDLILWCDVTTANIYLSPLGFIVGFVMFLGLTLHPKSYKVFYVYKKRLKSLKRRGK